MNFLSKISAITLLLGTVSTASFADDANLATITLNPAGPWNLHYENESCKLRRSFGNGDQQVSIEMTKFRPGERFELILFGKPLKPIYKGASYTVAFGSLPELDAASAMTAFDGNHVDVSLLTLNGFGPVDPKAVEAAFVANRPIPSTVSPEQRKSIKSISITIRKKQRFVLNSGSLEGAIASWDKCLAELVRSWGVDPTLQLAHSPIPKMNPADWLSADDYPKSALRENKGGVINFRLSVDEKGAVSKCSVQRAVNGSEFAAITCDLLARRASFKPAETTSGQAVPGFFQSSARFQIP
ncbi:energy transducer TonB [Novosphingobium aquiterrae]|uniref:Energy transducer TonB n=1 Tax=Novosphingobium aquiterrae TaxID=624388 RepID=A0ABV6PIT5_9SPHN